MTERRDYAYEALAEVTATDWVEGRGALNAALRSIRDQMPELADLADSFLLADEIHTRAQMYREVMPDVVLTPPALAKNWLRVKEESERLRAVAQERAQAQRRVTNASAPSTNCETCGGDLFVVYAVRTDGTEEMAPCPDCGTSAGVEFRRPDGSLFRAPDPAAVRARMRM